MEEGEVSKVREAGAKNAIINHGKVEGRDVEAIGISIAIFGSFYYDHRRNTAMVINCIDLNSPAYLFKLVLLVLLFEFHYS